MLKVVDLGGAAWRGLVQWFMGWVGFYGVQMGATREIVVLLAGFLTGLFIQKYGIVMGW